MHPSLEIHPARVQDDSIDKNSRTYTLPFSPEDCVKLNEIREANPDFTALLAFAIPQSTVATSPEELLIHKLLVTLCNGQTATKDSVLPGPIRHNVIFVDPKGHVIEALRVTVDIPVLLRAEVLRCAKKYPEHWLPATSRDGKNKVYTFEPHGKRPKWWLVVFVKENGIVELIGNVGYVADLWLSDGELATVVTAEQKRSVVLSEVDDRETRRKEGKPKREKEDFQLELIEEWRKQAILDGGPLTKKRKEHIKERMEMGTWEPLVLEPNGWETIPEDMLRAQLEAKPDTCSAVDLQDSPAADVDIAHNLAWMKEIDAATTRVQQLDLLGEQTLPKAATAEADLAAFRSGWLQDIGLSEGSKQSQRQVMKD